jgi:hypothetical protein
MIVMPQMMKPQVAPSGSQTFFQKYPGVAGAYSLRDIDGSSDPIVRLYSVASETEQDFTASDITDGTVETFADSDNVHVAKFYDQSGNGQTLNLMSGGPPIALSGIVNIYNGNPFVYFAGGAYLEGSVNTGVVDDLTIACVFKEDTNSNADRVFGIAGGSGSDKATFALATDNSLRFDGAFAAGSLSETKTYKIRIATKNSNAVGDYINGEQNISSTISGLQTEGDINLGNVSMARSTYFIGDFFEAILWYSDMSDDLTDLFSDLNDYYGIY